MIIDKLSNLYLYKNLSPYIPFVVDYIKNNDLDTLSCGTHYIIGKKLYVNVEIVTGKSKEFAILESHRMMFDIQIPLSSAEIIGYSAINDLGKTEYIEDRDILFYKENVEQFILVKPGYFAIFFPNDAHAPCISTNETIRKAVFKVII